MTTILFILAYFVVGLVIRRPLSCLTKKWIEEYYDWRLAWQESKYDSREEKFLMVFFWYILLIMNIVHFIVEKFGKYIGLLMKKIP